MELQTVFYVIGIIFMVVMLILITALVVAVFVIRSKIVALEASIQRKFESVAKVTSKGSVALYALRYFVKHGFRRGA